MKAAIMNKLILHLDVIDLYHFLCHSTSHEPGAVGARLHCDDEQELYYNQPIAVVSLDVVRTVQFVGNNQESFMSNALTISPGFGSAYVMTNAGRLSRAI